MGRILDAGRVFHKDGKVAASGTATFYTTGTTTLKGTFSDAALSVANANPLTLNSEGRLPAEVFGSGSYTVTVKDVGGGSVWSEDDVRGHDALGLAYNQGGTGAVDRTLESRIQDVTSVKDFGAKGDNSNDDTAEIQAAIDAMEAASGGVVYFPNGTYLISSELVIDSQSVSLVGENRFGSLIKQTTLSAKILNSTARYFTVRSLSLHYDGTPTSGAQAIRLNEQFATVTDIFIRAAWDGIALDTTARFCSITNFNIFNYENTGILLTATNDHVISNFFLQASTATRGILGGIRVINKSQGNSFSNGQTANGVFPMTIATSPQTFVEGNRPAYNKFTNIYFDSAAKGVLLQDVVSTEFVSCFFANGRTSPVGDGCNVLQSDSLSFIDCQFLNCGNHGMNVNATTANNLSFVGCDFNSNSVTSASGVGNGLFILSGVKDFTIIGCKANDDLFAAGRQGDGIEIGANCDRFSIIGCNVTGNVTSGISDGSSATAEKHIVGNLGHLTESQGTGSITSGVTTDVITHGLAITPVVGNIHITLSENPTNTPGAIFVTTITSTAFTVNCENDPGASNLDFGWSVR